MFHCNDQVQLPSTSTKYKYQEQVPSTSIKYNYQIQVSRTSTKCNWQVQVPSKACLDYSIFVTTPTPAPHSRKLVGYSDPYALDE